MGDYDGRTPLHIAYGFSHNDIVELLINKGKADENCKDNFGNLPKTNDNQLSFKKENLKGIARKKTD